MVKVERGEEREGLMMNWVVLKIKSNHGSEVISYISLDIKVCIYRLTSLLISIKLRIPRFER